MNLLQAVESAVGAICVGTWYVLAQGAPEDVFDWTNLSASVVLGGLCVYLVTRIIPNMHDKFNERLEKRDAQFDATIEKIHGGWQSAIDRIVEKLDDIGGRK